MDADKQDTSYQNVLTWRRKDKILGQQKTNIKGNCEKSSIHETKGKEKENHAELDL